MTFDLIFLLRESAPGLVELAFSVGIVASVSALASFGVSALSRRVFDGGAALLVLALVFAPEPAAAFDVRHADEVRIGADESIDESLLVRGADRVVVEGRIDGDLIVGSERVTLRGEVLGSVYVFCRDLEISGRVGGGVHAIAETARIDGEVAGRVYALSEEFTLARGGRARSDVSVFAEEASFEGAVGRDLQLAVDYVELRGPVGRDVSGIWIDEIALADGAHVRGDVAVTLAEGQEVERAAGARVDGEVRVTPRRSVKRHYLSHYTHWRFYAGHLLWFAAAFVFGLVAYRFAPAMFRGDVRTNSDLLRALAWGFGALIVAPAAMLVAALTVVGIPLAVVALFLYVVGLYTADLAVGAWLGRVLAPPADASLMAFGKSFGVGLALLTGVAMVPFLGPPIGLVALVLGLGLLTLRTREMLG